MKLLENNEEGLPDHPTVLFCCRSFFYCGRVKHWAWCPKVFKGRPESLPPRAPGLGRAAARNPCRRSMLFIRTPSLFVPNEPIKVCCRRFPRGISPLGRIRPKVSKGRPESPLVAPAGAKSPCCMLMLLLRTVGQSCAHRAHRGDSILISHDQRALGLSCIQRAGLSLRRSICFIAFSAGESSQRALGEAKRKEFGPRGLPQTPGPPSYDRGAKRVGAA